MSHNLFLIFEFCQYFSFCHSYLEKWTYRHPHIWDLISFHCAGLGRHLPAYEWRSCLQVGRNCPFYYSTWTNSMKKTSQALWLFLFSGISMGSKRINDLAGDFSFCKYLPFLCHQTEYSVRRPSRRAQIPQNKAYSKCQFGKKAYSDSAQVRQCWHWFRTMSKFKLISLKLSVSYW